MDRRLIQRQEAFYRECRASDSSDLHHWTPVWVGKGFAAGLTPEQVKRFLIAVTEGRPGKTPRRAVIREIETTVDNLWAKSSFRRYEPRRQHQAFLPAKPAKELEQDIRARQAWNRSKLVARLNETLRLSGNREIDERVLSYRSPSRFPENPIAQSRYFLERMFFPEDRVFLAPQVEYARNPAYSRPVKDRLPELPNYSPGWIESDKAESVPQFISVCTFTGSPNAEGSLTAGDCRARQDYGLIEFDSISLEEQRKAWLAMLAVCQLPIVAIVHSGNKSYHVWLRLQGSTPSENDKAVEEYYNEVFTPLGVDVAKKGKATRARLPGAMRRDKSGQLVPKDGAPAFSRLVYFDESLAVNQVVEVPEVVEVTAVEEIGNQLEPGFLCPWF